MIKNRLMLQKRVGIARILNDWFSAAMPFGDNLFVKKIAFEDRQITIFIGEEYFFRINSTLTVTVIVEETADKTTVDVISSGGKTNMWFSYGAEKSAVKRIVKMLKGYGFTEQ